VIDLSHPRFEEQMEAVEKILEELELNRIPLLRVFNKVDKVDPEIANRLGQAFGAVCISALDPGTFPPLLEKVEEKLSLSPTSFPDQPETAGHRPMETQILSRGAV
jgi:GTP-binding protein HflX